VLTLADALARNARHHGARPAILDGETTLTWQQFAGRVHRAGGVLRARGVDEGARYAIYARNGPRFEEIKWAGYHANSVPATVNWRLAPPEVTHILKDSDARAVFVDAEFAPIFKSPELAPWRERIVLLDTAPCDIDAPRYDDLHAAANPVAAGSATPEDDAILLYTGGTTGRSKGVRLTHTNVVSCGAAFALGMRARPDDVFLHVPPMFHSADLLATGWILLGAANCYLPAFTPAAFLEAIARYRVTMTSTVPTMLIMILTDPAFEKADISSLRVMNFGSAPMDPQWVKRVAAAFPHVDISNTYGLTESSPDLTIFDPADFRAAIEAGDPKLASVGRPNIFDQLRIVGEDGEDAPPGEPGELWARGPNITRGYLNLPKVTKDAFRDGWFRTGDIARIDEDGYVYLLDRAKDMIISGGENVYCAEVEAALYKHPDVLECAVFGLPDAKYGEAVAAAVVPRADARPDPAEIIAHCRKLIAGYKIPRRIEVVEALPKTAMGKVMKTELRRAYGETAAA
jgi:long-chain acyl-CoA synthetase